jgi:hypothetical protein
MNFGWINQIKMVIIDANMEPSDGSGIAQSHNSQFAFRRHDLDYDSGG